MQFPFQYMSFSMSSLESRSIRRTFKETSGIPVLLFRSLSGQPCGSHTSVLSASLGESPCHGVIWNNDLHGDHRTSGTPRHKDPTESEWRTARQQPMHVCQVTQSCLTLCDLMDCSSPGSSAHGSLQPRILEWVATPSSRGFSSPRDRTPHLFSCTGRWVLYH